MNEKIVSGNHTVIIQNRSKINISGVAEVISFDEQTVSLKTEMGNLIVKGEQLKVDSFTVETGDLVINGDFFAMTYSVASKRSIASRLFK